MWKQLALIALLITTSMTFSSSTEASRHGASRPRPHQREVLPEKPPPTPRKQLAIQDIYVVHFLLDGFNADLFAQLLREGKLPTVQAAFGVEGLISDGVTSFPTTSTTSYQSFMTGLFPGTAGIPHLERYDRTTKKTIGYLTLGGHDQVNEDLMNLRILEDPRTPELFPPLTIFELLDGYPTAAIYSSFHRGATTVHPRHFPLRAIVAAFITHDVANIDRYAMHKVLDLFRQEEASLPRYTFVALPAIDLAGHQHGAHSKEVAAVAVQFDRLLGEFLALLNKRGLRDKTALIITADHGMHNTEKKSKLHEDLWKAGVMLRSKNPQQKEHTLYVTNRGVGSTQLYFTSQHATIHGDPLRRHPLHRGGELDLIAFLKAHPSTQFIAFHSGADGVILQNTAGDEAHILCSSIDHQRWCTYEFKGQQDPLRYCSDPRITKLCDGQTHLEDEWLTATAHHEYPDAVVSLWQLFQTPRTGDIIVVAKPTWSYRKAKRATHGTLQREDMRIPILIKGPGVPHHIDQPLRSVDIFPWLLRWFGIPMTQVAYDGHDRSKNAPEQNISLQRKLAAIDHLMGQRPSVQKIIDVPGFVKREFISRVGAASFPELARLARKEVQTRHETLTKLTLMFELADPEDSLRPLLEANIDRAREKLKRMEEIHLLLTACQQPAGESCWRL